MTTLPNFPIVAGEDFTALPYGFEHLRVYNCPVPTPGGAGGYAYGRLYVAVVVSAGTPIRLRASEPGHVGVPDAPFVGLSTVSADDALDTAAANLRKAATRP